MFRLNNPNLSKQLCEQIVGFQEQKVKDLLEQNSWLTKEQIRLRNESRSYESVSPHLKIVNLCNELCNRVCPY